ncbi:hypothetical protein [uncultured Acetobacteroides sp.]|uniref:hypothetical protein n=1 Tax=uncultured Acetobacteroides sp. TaxID=1760811 RepID=UPI0029F5C2EF|nr:hypothetical protein [uncultured Acetobacteroides sp.]
MKLQGIVRKTSIAILLLIGVSLWVQAQNRPPKLRFEDIYTKIDTFSTSQHYYNQRCRWFNDTVVTCNLVTPHTFDLQYYLKSNRLDSTYVPTDQEKERYLSFFEIGAQNCHSYSLECYFKNSGIEGISLFDHNTSVGSEYLTKILASTFEKVQELTIKPKHKPKEGIVSNTILVFSSRYSRAIHSVYYSNGVYFSKNGAFAPKTYSNLNDILKLYFDTTIIEAYQLKAAIRAKL